MTLPAYHDSDTNCKTDDLTIESFSSKTNSFIETFFRRSEGCSIEGI